MHDAEAVEGAQIDALIERFFAEPLIAFLHAHNPYACRINRG